MPIHVGSKEWLSGDPSHRAVSIPYKPNSSQKTNPRGVWVPFACNHLLSRLSVLGGRSPCWKILSQINPRNWLVG